MSLTRLSWLRNAFLPLALAVLRVCLLWLWAALLQQLLAPSIRNPALPGWLMTAVLLLSFGLTRFVNRLEAGERIGRFLIAAIGLGVLLFLQWFLFYQTRYAPWDSNWFTTWGQTMLFWETELPPAYITLFFLAYLWLRGILDGSRELKHQVFMNAFVAGCVGLVCYLLLLAAGGTPPPTALGSIVFLFFGTAMIMLALSSVKTERVFLIGASSTVQHVRLSRYWLSTVLLVIAGLLGLAILLSAIIVPETLATLLNWVTTLLTELLILAIRVISILLYPIIWLLFTILTPIFQAIFANSRLETAEPIGREGLQPLPPDELAERTIELTADFRWLILFLVLIAIFLLFFYLWRRISSGEDGWAVNEERESIYARGMFMAQLGDLLPSWLGGESGKRPLSPYLSLNREADPRRTIRQLYQQLLAASKPRRRGHTPRGHGQQLEIKQVDSLDTLTEAYNQARYDKKLPAETAVGAAKTAWKALESELTHEEDASL